MPYCNLACEWCDTKFDTFKKWDETAFRAFAEASPELGRFAVVTGGEPTLHKHTRRVVEILKSLRFVVAVESNGTVESDIYSVFDFVTISPKRQAADKGMVPYQLSIQATKYASEFKYVVDKEFDFSILSRHDVWDGKRYSLSPEFGAFKESIERIIEYIDKNPGWRISLQTHKWMGIA